jgi:hypothetical protein
MTLRDSPLPSFTDRRARQRFAVVLPLKWRAGHGDFIASRTRNMSSTGLAIAIAGAAPKAGTEIEVVVAWPVLFDRTIGLQLWIWGKVVRSSAGEFAVKYRQYEIRTKGSRGQTMSLQR